MLTPWSGRGELLVQVMRRGFGGSLRDEWHAEVVDPAARRALADLIAAYLRGEIITSVFSTRCNAFLDKTADPDIPEIVLALQYCIEDRLMLPMWLSEDQWQVFRRLIAYLNTDHRLTPRVFRVPLKQQLAADGVLVLWVGALLTALLVEHTLAGLAAWILIGLLWQGLRRTVCVPEREYAPIAAYVPFRSAADWREHESILERYNLPPYDPGRNRPPSPWVAWMPPARTLGPWTPEPCGMRDRVEDILALPLALIVFQRPTVLPVIDELPPGRGDGG